MNEPYKMIVNQDGKEVEETYQAIIGIKIEGGKVILHIRENGDLDEQFWRNLPNAMKQTIEKGLEIRREANR
jgi:transposase-like protein